MTELPDMTGLTGKQTMFVQGVMNGLSDINAYRQAGYSQAGTPTIQAKRAQEVKNNRVISAILTNFRLRLAEKIDMSVESHIKELSELAILAKGLGQYGPATRAVELKGKVAGHYVERIRQEPAPQVADAFQVMISEIADVLGDAAAREYAKQKGVEWLPARDTDDSTTEQENEA